MPSLDVLPLSNQWLASDSNPYTRDIAKTLILTFLTNMILITVGHKNLSN
jgi:hypothetical protein